MGEFGEALERAETEVFARTPPKTLKAQIAFLLRQLKTARAVAAGLGVGQRSVERYRKGDRRHPPRRIQHRIGAAVRARWRPRVRRRRRRQAATTGGITIGARARFGCTAPTGSTDDGRLRRLTVRLPPACARRLFDARAQGAGDRRLREIVAEGLPEVCFRDGGRRAAGLLVEFTGIDHVESGVRPASRRRAGGEVWLSASVGGLAPEEAVHLRLWYPCDAVVPDSPAQRSGDLYAVIVDVAVSAWTAGHIHREGGCPGCVGAARQAGL